jgi:hypothetical protein
MPGSLDWESENSVVRRRILRENFLRRMFEGSGGPPYQLNDPKFGKTDSTPHSNPRQAL